MTTKTELEKMIIALLKSDVDHGIMQTIISIMLFAFLEKNKAIVSGALFYFNTASKLMNPKNVSKILDEITRGNNESLK